MRTLILTTAASLLVSGNLWAQELSLNANPIMVEPGEFITLTLDVDAAVTNLRGYTLDLHYNRDQVSLFSISEGAVLLSHAPTFLYWEDEGTNGESVIHVDHAILGGASGGNGAGSLLYFTFVADYCGIETLWVDNALFRNMDNMALSIAVGPGVEHQICQIPPLHIEYQLGASVLLTWNRVINANLFHVYRAPEVAGPYALVHTTIDTFWVDTNIPIDDKRMYHIIVDHN